LVLTISFDESRHHATEHRVSVPSATSTTIETANTGTVLDFSVKLTLEWTSNLFPDYFGSTFLGSFINHLSNNGVNNANINVDDQIKQSAEFTADQVNANHSVPSPRSTPYFGAHLPTITIKPSENEDVRTHQQNLAIINPNPIRLITDEIYLLHHLFEAQAKLHPNRPAIRFLHDMESQLDLVKLEEWTYEKVERRANQMARYIHILSTSTPAPTTTSTTTTEKIPPSPQIHTSLRPDSIIPVYLPQSPEFYISVLGVLKSGCAFLPMSEEMPLDRLRFIWKDCEAEVVVTNKKLYETFAMNARGNQDLESLLADGNIQFLIVDDEQIGERIDMMDSTLLCLEKEVYYWERNDEDLEAGEVAETIAFQVESEHLAYLQYTSGSTGAPKGAMIEVCHFRFIVLIL
jgi:hypothetical protein